MPDSREANSQALARVNALKTPFPPEFYNLGTEEFVRTYTDGTLLDFI